MALPGFSCQSKAEPQTKRWAGGQTKCDKSSRNTTLKCRGADWVEWANANWNPANIYIYLKHFYKNIRLSQFVTFFRLRLNCIKNQFAEPSWEFDFL